MSAKHSEGITRNRVLIFPAMTPKVSNRPVHFLFSLSQVADIVRIAPIRPIPFSPRFILGVSRWRKTVLPVISLEACLGLESPDHRDVRRRMVVRSVGNPSKPNQGKLCMLDVGPSTRMLSLPIECQKANGNSNWIPQKDLIRGVYSWAEGFIVIAHMEKVLTARYKPSPLVMPEMRKAGGF